METGGIYLNQLIAIIQLVEKGEITGENNALHRFKQYLGTIESLGSFDPVLWQNEWRKEVWKLGTALQDQNLNQFLNALNESLKTCPVSGREVLEFIKSVFDSNFLPADECIRRFTGLTQEYPLNPEFRYALGRVYSLDNDFKSALTEYKLALKIDPGNALFIDTWFNEEQRYLDKLIDTGEFETAGNYVQELLSDINLMSLTGARSTFTGFARRIKEYRIMQDKVKTLEAEFKEKMHSELEHERRRLIEIFGFFAAIVAFLLSTVSIGENFSFVEALYFIIALGIILILFVTAVFTIFSSERTRLKQDKRFWILIAGLVLLFLLIVRADSVSKIIEQLISKS